MSPPTTITENNNKRKRGDESDDEDEQQSSTNNNSKSKKLSPVSSSVQGINLLEENNVSMGDTTTNQLLVNNSASSSSSSVQQTSTFVLTDDDKKEQFIELDPTQYNTWTKEEVYSLLRTPEEKGGAGLSSEDVKPLYDAGFKGTSLANIVKYLSKRETSVVIDETKKNFADISRDVLTSVVYWAVDLLNTRLYHLWSTKHAKEQLGLPISNGGAGLSEEELGPFKGSYQETDLGETITKKIKDFISKKRLTIPNTLKRLLSRVIISEGRESQIADYNPASQYMEFIGGEELGMRIMPNIQVRYAENTDSIRKDKSSTPIIVFATAPGTGKTRNAMEAVECVKQVMTDDNKLKPYLDYRLEFYLIMGRNGMRNLRYKSDIDRNRLNYVERFFTIRICYLFATHYLKIEFNEDDWGFETLEQFAQFLKDGCLEPNSKFSIVVVIDEFQKLNSPLDYNLEERQTERTGLDVSLNVLGGASTALATKDVLFIPIFSGISYSPIYASIRKSTHPSIHIQPVRSRMSIEDILLFLNKFISMQQDKANKLGLTQLNLLKHDELVKCLNKCCGYPRLIEYMLLYMAADQNWSNIQLNIVQSIPKFSDFSSTVIDKIFSYHLTRKRVVREELLESGIRIESLEDSGCITLEENETTVIVQPNLPFSVTIPSNDETFANLITRLTTIIEKKGAQYLHDTELESFNASFEVAKCRAHRLLGYKKVLFKDYFYGMIPTLALKNSLLWTESNILLDEFNVTFEMITADHDTSDQSKHYVYQKTSNTKGADRMCVAIIEYPNGPTVTTKLLFQDRGMEWDANNQISTIQHKDIVTELGKNVEIATSWTEIEDTLGKKFQHPNVLLIYCGLKYISKLQDSLQPTPQQQQTGKINFNSTNSSNLIHQQPIMVLGSSEANNLQLYYGKPIYHAMFRLSLPKVVNMKKCAGWVFRLLFGKFNATAKDIENIKTSLAKCDKGLKYLSELKQLTVIDIRKNWFSVEGFKHLSELKQLTNLNVSGNVIGKESLKYLTRLETLKRLNISNCFLGVYGIECISQLKQLTDLNVSFNNIGNEGVKYLTQLKHLTEINISNNPINKEGVQYFTEMKQLVSLDISNTIIGDEGTKILTKLETLKRLNVSNSCIGDDGIKTISEMKQLTDLNISFNYINVNGFKHLIELDKLTYLNTNSNNISSEEAKYISEMKQLVYLDISTNVIRVEGCKHISKLINLTALEISNNGIGNEGVQYLSELKKLTEINISFNGIDEEGVNYLNGLKQLKKIDNFYSN